MGELIVILLKGLTSKFAALSVKILAVSKTVAVKILALVAAAGVFFYESLPRLLPEYLPRIATQLALRIVSNDPEVQKATFEMANELGQALWIDYFVIITVLVFCMISLLIFIVSPLTYKALSRSRLGIFISFNRAREDIAEDLQKHLETAGARVFRIPFQEGATHQNIVMQATKGIKECDSFVCLPGDTQSYVEHEVLAATTAGKAVAFLISDTGTLPNTADKRYPMFRLEPTIREQFQPLINFLSYVGADLKSTWKLCQRAVRNPFMSMSMGVALSLGGICLLVLWAYCYFKTVTNGQNLTNSVPAFAEVETPVILAQVFVLCLAASIAFLSLSYSSIVFVNLIRQFLARNKARLKTVAAQFNRNDWIGIVPDLSPGGNIYECLFETAPSAHHEIESKREAS
jgi:TIR domain